jgi:hypothetical protein
MHVPILNIFKHDDGIFYRLYKIDYILIQLIYLVII